MKNWKYRELVDVINEELKEFEQDKELNYSNEVIVGRTLYESITTIKDGYTEAVIVYSVIGKYVIKKCSTVYLVNNKEEFINVLGIYEKGKLDGSLKEEEIAELEKNIETVLRGFKEKLKEF